jgi:hypothetical protein
MAAQAVHDDNRWLGTAAASFRNREVANEGYIARLERDTLFYGTPLLSI